MTDINAEHLPDAGFWYTSLGKDDPIIRVRHEQCSVEEAYPATFSLPGMRDAYRAAHPAPDPALAVVIKSDRHEDAFWYAFTATGGLPWTPESGCFEGGVWNAYLDLQYAGLLTADPDSDVKRYDHERERYCTVRAKYRPTAAAVDLLPKLQAYRKDFPNV